MEHFYFHSHKKASARHRFPVKLTLIQFTGKAWQLVLILTCLATSSLFSQTTPSSSNNAFWSAYADKMHLGPKEREEFLTAHRRIDSAAAVTVPQAQQPQQPAGRNIGAPNTLFAGACINADFEMGNLTGWTTTKGFNPGFTLTPACCPTSGGQQTIMSGGNDPFGGFPVVSPGGSFSLRLGNSGTGGQADRIEQTFLVSAANANFSYKYAVVFEDPNHTTAEQPYFEISLFDAGGVAVPCTFYHVAAGGGIPGFFNSTVSGATDVIYKPWSTVLVDLTPYIGQNITIRFDTYDCSLGGHFGYAYIDGVCQSFSSGGSATVCAGTSTTFCAPSGVSSYTWNGPGISNFAAQCATATAAGIYTVSTTLFTGCQGPTFTYTLVTQAPPLADAGPPSTTVCANNSTVSLSGSITGYTATPVWSASGTGGVFTSTNTINTSYIPSAANISAGTVTITLTTAGNGVCPVSTDKMVISITPSPVVNAGTGGSACNSNPFALNGTVTAGASTGTWSTSGDGSFSPSFSVLNASYTPGAADIAAGSVTLTLTSTNNGNCFPNSDTLIILTRKPSTANAGANQSICSSASTIAISGIIGGGTTTGAWSSSGAGLLSPATPVLNKTYSITTADILAGEVTFSLTSTNNGPCPASIDTVKMVIVRPATVTAGPNQFLCSTAGSINLVGSVTSSSNTGTWATGTSGILNPASVLNPTFTPATIGAGTIIFTLTSTNNGPCAAVSDTVMMRIRIPATVTSGTNQVLCSNAGSVNLAGTVGGGGSTGVWTVSSDGDFTPINTVLNTVYGITATDIANGSVVFTLTSSNNGPCAAAQSTVMAQVIKIATVTAGPNQLVCSSPGSINLAGTINSPSNTLVWSRNGTGNFSPSGSVLTPTYGITAADITAGSVIFTISSTNNGPCPVVSDSVEIVIKELAIINAGISQTICSNSASVNLSGTTGGGATTVSWASSVSGNFLSNTTNLTPSYAVTAADINAGNVTFTLTSNNNGPCPAASSTVMATITKIATLTAGPNLYVCSNATTLNLAGSVNSPSNTGTWTGNGSGTFIPNAAAVNTTYSFSPADVAAGAVIFTLTSTNNGVCPAVKDTVKMKLLQLAAVNAGTTQTICSNAGTVALSGTVTGAGGTGSWSTNGPGAFNPGNALLNTSYSITPANIGAGLVIFTLSSTNNGPCPVVTHTVQTNISLLATVNAGVNQYICSSQNSITLGGTVAGVTSTGQWAVSGVGPFSPANTALGASYSLTPIDIATGHVTFTLTSTNNGVCPAVPDTVKMKIMKLPVVNAGLNQALCSTAGTLALNGIVTSTSGTGSWSADGPGAFTPGNTALSTIYSITPADITNGQVIFTLTSTNNSPCPAVSDSVKITIKTLANVNAGVNQFVCSSQNSITLNGTVTGGTSTGQWLVSGVGPFSPSNTALGGSYSLTPIDIAIGSVIFTLTSTNNGVCAAVSDTVKMKIMKLATVNSGTNQVRCSTAGTIALNGTVTGAAGTGSWATDGAGIFIPGNGSLTTSYSITPTDITNGQVIFTLTSTGNGPCAAVSDTVKMLLKTIASVSAGVNQFICSSQNSIALNGIVSGVTSTGQWSSPGAGSFLPGNTDLAGSYSITPIDIFNGAVTLTLTSTNNGVCPAVRDTVKMKIRKLPAVSSGANQLVCSTQGSITLAGTVNGGGSTGSWLSSGNGTFTPGPNGINTAYLFSTQDITNGSAVFSLTSQNSAPCPEITDTTTMVIRTPALVLAGSSQTICSNAGNINLQGSVTGGLSMVSWSSNGSGSFNPGNTSAVTAYAMSPADINSGAVNFTLVSTNNGTCPQSISNVAVFIKQKAHVNAGPDKSICSTQLVVQMQGLISGVTTTGLWTGNGTGTLSPNQPATSYSISAADISQGTMRFILTSSDNDVCPAVSDTMNLTIMPKPVVAVGTDTTVCEKQTMIALSASVISGSGMSQWSTSGSGAFLPVNSLAATHYSLSNNDKTNGNVALSFGFPSTGPCGYTGSTMQVHVLPGPHAAFSASAYTIQLPGDQVQFSNATTAGNTYTWTFGDGAGSTVNDPSHNYTNVGFYNAVLIARNDNGCMDTTTQLITVISDVQFPTAFTPNTHGGNGGYYDKKDYSNDVFFPYTLGVTNYDLMIFNRWGELIFKSNDVNVGWDGYFNGKLCQQDVYVWKLNLEFFDGRKYNKTGSVTLLR